jgi:hypothetical protein
MSLTLRMWLGRGCVVDMNNSRTVRLLASWQESGGNLGAGRNRSGVSLRDFCDIQK